MRSLVGAVLLVVVLVGGFVCGGLGEFLDGG